MHIHFFKGTITVGGQGTTEEVKLAVRNNEQVIFKTSPLFTDSIGKIPIIPKIYMLQCQ